MQRLTFRPTILIFFIAITTSATAAVLMLLLHFDGIEFNGDSFVYFRNARHFYEALAAHTVPMPKHWPYGYPALLSVAFAIGDIKFESARWVNVLLGGLFIAVLCSLMLFVARLKKLPDYHAFLLVASAGVLPLAHGLFLKYELSMMSDMTAMLWTTLMLLFCWRWRGSGNLVYIVLAGVALGLAVFTRYVYSLMLAPALVVLLFDIELSSWRSVKRVILATFLFALAALVTFCPQLYITIQDTSSSLGNGLLHDWNIRNFYTLAHESVDGHQTTNIPSILYYASLPFRWQCFTPFGALLVVLGAKYAIRELPRWLWLSLLAWYGIMYLLLCGIPIQNARIGFPLFLPVTVFVSLGILECLLSWEYRFRTILIVIVLLWCASLVASVRGVYHLVKTKNKLKSVAESVVGLVPKNSRVISTSLYAVYGAYPMAVEPYSIYEMSIAQARTLLADKKPTFLAIDEDNFFAQWTKYPPGKCYAWIQRNYICERIKKIGDYTVYEIKSR